MGLGHEKLDVYRLSIGYVAWVYAKAGSLTGVHRPARAQWLRASQSIPLKERAMRIDHATCRKASVLLLALIVSLTAHRLPAQDIVLRVAYDHWPPWKIADEGVTGGIDAELLHAIERKTDIRFEFVVAPWKRCIEMLIAGRIDLVVDWEIPFDYIIARAGTLKSIERVLRAMLESGEVERIIKTVIVGPTVKKTGERE